MKEAKQINTTRDCVLIAGQSGIRLDRYVAEHCPEITRTHAQRLIAGGYIRVNGRLAKAGLKISAGDSITVSIPPPTPSGLVPDAIPLHILYEDADLMVIDKPPGLTVHPAPGHPRGTLANAILARLERSPEGGEWWRPGIVHRLDKDTSGLIVVARNSAAHLSLTSQFKSRSVVKIYQALVKGRLTPQEGIIEAPIGRDTRHRERMAIVAEGKGRPARTKYRVIKYIDDYTLVEIMPETGRTHQIRVHLAAIGYPVVGDATYG
ncbi:MAG: RluA family pseudouridine synthase, partial [Chloroflexi bacterium]|nr:RluA family pseudouridine synthase [Chloroflexota bacterium]